MASEDEKPIRSALTRNEEETSRLAAKAAAILALAILDAVREMGPDGTVAGHLYATCMTTGMSLQTFERLMGALVEAGKLRKVGYVYYAIEYL